MAKKWILPTLAAVAVAVGIVACGGGGGGGGETSSAIPVVGTAATGSALTDGTVQIYGADGVALLSTPAKIASNGSYSATIPAGAKFPLVFVADDGSQKLVSVMATAKDTAIVNVTQLTNLLAARLSPSGDPANLLAEIGSGTTVNTANVQSKITEMLTAIKPLLDAHNLSATDNPVTTTFVANGAGYDKMLDTLDVKIEPKGSISTIELTVKKAVAEDAPLPNVALLSTGSIPTLPSVSASDLPADGLTLALKELLDQATTCYGLDKAVRVNVNGTGVAGDITAQACKDMFDGKDPRNYKSGGHIVKSTDHFGGIFNATLPVTFSSPRYYYTISADAPTYPNGPKAGDVVFGYRWKDDYGNFQYERNVVRKDPTDGKYRFIGNKYVYPGGTSAYAQRRNFLMQPNSTYISVGYVFDVPCISGANGNTSWKKVVVTSPNEKRITLMPNATGTTCNYSYFTVSPDGTSASSTGTGFIRIRSEYENTTNVPSSHPRALDAGLAFVQTDLLESEIEQIPQFGRWKYEYYLDATSVSNNAPNKTQYFRTITRAMTIAGFKQSVKLPSLESVYQAALIASATPNCSAAGCYVVPNSPFNVKWTVSPATQAMAEPPATYRVRIYGKYGSSGSRVGYEDTNDVRSSFRSTDIRCGNGDSFQLQCETLNGVLVFAKSGGARGYNANTSVGNIDLVSRLPDGSDASHFHTLSKLP